MFASHWLQVFLAGVSLAGPSHPYKDQTVESLKANCDKVIDLQIANATIYLSEVVTANTNLSFPDNNSTCYPPSQIVYADLCRVALYVATSNASGFHMEAWLPLNWNGRFLSAGNGGLNGCVGYDDLAYGTSLGFASVGTNNGHNGTSGGAFLNQPEVIEDFVYRAVVTGAKVGKYITKTFYGKQQNKSYYLGCSTGGRQGFKFAQDYPDIFDGIVAGAPAFNWNNFISFSSRFYTFTGPNNSPTAIPAAMWDVIHEDVNKQCDMLDGSADGILETPSNCDYQPAGLLCGEGANTTACLTATQLETLNKIYNNPLRENETVVYPRMQPGGEKESVRRFYLGVPFQYAVDWFRYVVYNNPTFDVSTITGTDFANADHLNPWNIKTWEGNLSGIQSSGAKVLHWHGQQDGLITSAISEMYREHVLKTMNLTNTELDNFYRFFRISGTGHCATGDGAWAIGQDITSVQSTDPSENVLTAMVNWVEKGIAPETIVGTRWVNSTKDLGVEYKRAHCKYPLENHYKGSGGRTQIENWECI